MIAGNAGGSQIPLTPWFGVCEPRSIKRGISEIQRHIATRVACQEFSGIRSQSSQAIHLWKSEVAPPPPFCRRLAGDSLDSQVQLGTKQMGHSSCPGNVDSTLHFKNEFHGGRWNVRS